MLRLDLRRLGQSSLSLAWGPAVLSPTRVGVRVPQAPWTNREYPDETTSTRGDRHHPEAPYVGYFVVVVSRTSGLSDVRSATGAERHNTSSVPFEWIYSIRSTDKDFPSYVRTMRAQKKSKAGEEGPKGEKGGEIGLTSGYFTPACRGFFLFFFLGRFFFYRKDGKQRKARQSSEDLQIVPSMGVRVGIGGLLVAAKVVAQNSRMQKI